ncbi:MAG: hypothetical protein E5X38_25300 [Mesorhizobium sp.]|uniref:hypothetical protein n=1 Tax=Mesorhizobium sp. TaxID=1871066 RepID=UPI0011F62007|nr:hypothetical protein [Mesorhizobium sp.]TIQ84444.1 MAG: hypothetical protein E5X38_25300 [Mesorhizobium sp.]
MDIANEKAGPLRTEPAFKIEVVEQAELKQRGRKAQDGLTPQKRWAERNPLKRWCHLATNQAIKKGILKRLPCAICGDPKTDAHHPIESDPEAYSKPLHGLVFYCRRHHQEAHRRMKCEAAE